MSEIEIKLDLSDLMAQVKSITTELVKDIQKGVQKLAEETHEHIVEQTENKLNNEVAKKYLNNLSEATQIDATIWEITLKEPAVPIEEGKEWDMKGEAGQWGLLKNSEVIKNGPNKGRHYKIIPMQQGGVSDTENVGKLSKQTEMRDTIKSFLKGKGLPMGIEKHTITDPVTGSPRKVPRMSEMGADGYPKPLHVFDIPSRIPGKGNTQQLARLHIYQVANKNGNAKKVMTTFRTVTDAPDQKDKWIYPAAGAKDFLTEAGKFAEQEWVNSIIPVILEKYK